MLGSVEKERERPEPNVKADPDEVIIPIVPYDDDTSPDCNQPDDWEEDED